MNYLYSNFKDEDFTPELCERLSKELKIGFLICDFTPNADLCSRLKKYGIKAYLSIKTCYLPTIQEIDTICFTAKNTGFEGVAIDSENYLNDGLYEDTNESYAYGRDIGNTIGKYFQEILTYPEFLGGDKYRTWPMFFTGLTYNIKYVTVLCERTYNTAEPWNLIYLYNRNKKYIKSIRKDINVYIGIWPESNNLIIRLIQGITARLLSDRVFVYSETKDVLKSNIGAVL